MEGKEKLALGYLPEHIRDAVVRTSSLYGCFDEIRLRLGRELSVTVEGKNLLCGLKCTREDLEYTVAGRATGASQIVGMAIVTTTAVDSVLTVRNPAGNTEALTITPLAGGTRPVSAHLVITQIQ